jgi:hypothetical protein
LSALDEIRRKELYQIYGRKRRKKFTRIGVIYSENSAGNLQMLSLFKETK